MSETAQDMPNLATLAKKQNGGEQVAASEHMEEERTAGAGDGPPRQKSDVAKIESGGLDCRNVKIDHVYFKRENYAIYSCKKDVMIQYSDNKDEATKQIAEIADLFPLRDRIQYLTGEVGLPNCYQAQTAEALRLGLEGQKEVAKKMFDAAIEDVVKTRATIGRKAYLRFAGPFAFLVAMVLIAMGAGAFAMMDRSIGLLLLATGAGALGALLSIAIAIRARTVAVEGDWKANATDGTLRVVIGVLSAAILCLFLVSGAVGITAGDVQVTGAAITWQIALLIGLAAGFLERMVPDLLEKTALTSAGGNGASRSTA
jgi:hypothetical protein